VIRKKRDLTPKYTLKNCAKCGGFGLVIMARTPANIKGKPTIVHCGYIVECAPGGCDNKTDVCKTVQLAVDAWNAQQLGVMSNVHD